MIKYEPWAESHEPKNFARTDVSGRWSPIEEPDFMDALGSDILAIIGGIFFGIVGAFVLYFWVTI